MWSWPALLSAFILWAAPSETVNSTIVSINDGMVQGETLSSANGRNYYAFMGIPYAKPPLNALRFKPPQPIAKWKDVFQANRKDVLCIQFDGLRYNDTEDCLVLNVYTPKLPSHDQCSQGLPVMVAFHEGAFLFGSGSFNFYDPSRFMDSDVVLVTTNYRLGVLGFLDTQDEQSSGNYGMMDQVATLRWVSDNIRAFGGDPKRVSIFGCSAGGASVTYHMLSPMSKGLFKAAIIQSGTAINPWAIQKDPLEWARKVARLVNCTNATTTKNLVSCLRKTSIDALVQARIMETAVYQYPYRLGPSVQSAGKDRFLTDHPLALLSDGRLSNKVPVMIGVMKDEAFSPSYFRKFLNDTRKAFAEDFCPFLNDIIDNNRVSNTTCDRAQRKYFNSTKIDDPVAFVDGFVKITGDVAQSSGIAKTAELLAAAGLPVQAYKMTYILQSSPLNEGRYVRHGDEMVLMFDRRWASEWNQSKHNFTENDNKMSNILRTIWTTFGMKQFNSLIVRAQYEDEFYWPLYNSMKRKYVELNLNFRLTSGLLCDTMDFWEAINWPSA